MARALPAVLLAAASCSWRPAAEGVRPGSRVSLHYTLRVEGAVYDSSEAGEPLTVTAGREEVLPGLDKALLGLKAGESREVVLPPDKTYGWPDPDKRREVPLERFGDLRYQLKAGASVKGVEGGEAVSARVLAVGPRAVLLDFNHPLAGKTLACSVRIVSVE